MPSPSISPTNRVDAIVRSAARRRFLVLTVEQLALALSIVFSGGILMLLLGTQILNWYWLCLLGAAGLSLIAWRIRTRVIALYRVAQIVDARLGLSDSISTAWFLLSRADYREDPIARLEVERAEQLAPSVDPARAFPFTGQRLWALTGALCAVVFGLFAVRYMVTSSLSLRPPLVAIDLGSVFERLEKSLSAENHQLPQPDTLDRQPANASNSADPQQNDGHSKLLGSDDSKTGKPDGTSSSDPAAQQADAKGEKQSQDGQSQSKESSPSSAQPTPGNQAQQPSGSQTSEQQTPNTKEQSAAGQQSSAGLMDKMKDALSSLMAKMRPDASSQKSLQNNEQSSEDQKSGGQTSTTKDQQNQSQNAQNQQAAQQQNSEGQAQGQTTEKADSSQGRNSEESSDKKASDAHSGIGRQDGDKDVKEAEQLQAMGKLAEIIGKRSANLTGEMMVETPSGKQRLKTEYSDRMGHHSDLGGEINRDEIPLMYQQYIREYMEQVRKQQGKTGQ